MTYTELEKAKEIKLEIEKFRNLRILCRTKKYLNFIPFKASRNGVLLKDGNDVIILEKGLNDLIETYCDRRIEELESDLEAI